MMKIVWYLIYGSAGTFNARINGHRDYFSTEFPQSSNIIVSYPLKQEKGLAPRESTVFPISCLLFKNLLLSLSNRRMQNLVTLQSRNEVDSRLFP